MNTWIKTTAVFAAGFLLGGAATGIGIRHCFQRFHPREVKTDFILNRLSKELDLTAEQKGKVDLLLKAQSPKMDALRKQTQDLFMAQRDAFNAKLRPILSEDQKKKLEAMNARWDGRMEGKGCLPFGCKPKAMDHAPPAGDKQK